MTNRPNYAPSNTAIADALETLADRLIERAANPHRVHAYQEAARTVRQHEQSLAAMLADGGVEALKTLPGIGDRLASRIAGFIRTGRLQLLEQIRSATDPVHLFTRVPGIGTELAQRIHDTLDIETLEELEVAAHDGRLDEVEGFGPGRVEAVRNQLGTMLREQSRRRSRPPKRGATERRSADEPPVRLLLDIDRTYRRKAERDELRRIAPRRFNPTGEAWLPIMETQRGPWHITALFSNTARAHRLDRTHDWVVIYCDHAERDEELQYTAVTETKGPLKGERVIRGREAACRRYYERRSDPVT